MTVNILKVTKKQQAKELYLKYHDLPRKDIAKKISEELEISIDSARTHISLSAKELNPKLNKPFLTRKRDPSKLKRAKAYDIFFE